MNMIEYWERRYRTGGISGAGSRGSEAVVKAQLVQNLINVHDISSVLDLGCGDGYIASMIYAERYVGYDPSVSATKVAQEFCPHLEFVNEVPDEEFDLILSMDVIFHLVTDDLYRDYLELLFSERARQVLVYGTDQHLTGAPHVLHRNWTPDIPDGWTATELTTEYKRAWLITRD